LCVGVLGLGGSVVLRRVGERKDELIDIGFIFFFESRWGRFESTSREVVVSESELLKEEKKKEQKTCMHAFYARSHRSS